MVGAQADEDGSNALDMDEFLAATLGHYRTNKEENLVFAFQYLDKDGSGQISIEEIKQACLEFGFSTADLPALFAEVDTNKVRGLGGRSPVGSPGCGQAPFGPSAVVSSCGPCVAVSACVERGWPWVSMGGLVWA